MGKSIKRDGAEKSGRTGYGACPCLCGGGYFVVRRWWEKDPWMGGEILARDTEIHCLVCSEEYELLAEDEHLEVFRRSDIEADEKRKAEWFDKESELKEYVKQKGYYRMLIRYLETLPSMKAVHHAVGRFAQMRYESFPRTLAWENGRIDRWLRNNLHGSCLGDALDALVGVSDTKMDRMIKVVEAIYARSEENSKPVKVIDV